MYKKGNKTEDKNNYNTRTNTTGEELSTEVNWGLLANEGPTDKVGTVSGIFDNQINFEWLTTEEAAEYLRVSAKYLLNLTSNGRVRYYKFGRRNRFLLSDLRSLLLAQARGGSYGN